MTTEDQSTRDEQARRQAALPPEEHDDDRTVGGGVMSEGGTAIVRGTGTLTGQAQGGSDDDDAPTGDEPDFFADEADAVLGHDERRHH